MKKIRFAAAQKVFNYNNLAGFTEENSDLYSSIFNNSHTPILVIDSKSGQIRDANLAACDFYRYSIEELRNLNINQINILSDQEIREKMEETKREGNKYFVFKHRISSGEIRAVEVYSGPIKVRGEHLLLSIIHDIEYKNEMEQIIRLKESYFKSLFENSPEAIAIFDNEFRFVNVNDSFVRVFQYTLEDVKYKNVTEVICNEKLYDESTYFKDSIRKGAFVRKETQRKRKDGKLIDISFLGYPILSGGEQVGVYAIYTDITKNKLYEEALKEAKHKAEKASEFKTKFIANVAHEIRTPMNGIVGIIDILEDNQLSHEHMEYFNMLRYSAERLSRIINDVMDIAKIETGKLELRKESFQIKELLRDIEKYFKIQAKKKNLMLELCIDPAIPDVLFGDEDKLNQVVFNLLSNAIKFTNNGMIRIVVALEKWKDKNVEIKFSVHDTGIGIPKDQLKNIFNDFFQMDSTRTRKCGGTGLGLAISEKLVQLMGGDLFVESEFGIGSTFYFKLEFEMHNKLKTEVKTVLQAAKEDFFEKNPGLKILLIEDDSINLKIIKSFLDKQGCIVTIAMDGSEAIDMLNKQSFDIILMDVFMPEMDGLELSEIIRDAEKAKGLHTPIILITAAVMNEDIERYYELGIDAVIAKPFKKDEIYEGIKRVLGKQSRKNSYDLNSLLIALDGDNKLLVELIEEVTDIRYQNELFGRIERFAEDNDFEELKKHLHKFKGSISHFHVESINNVLNEIKECCRKKDVVLLNVLLSRLKNEYLNLKDFLIEYAKNMRD